MGHTANTARQGVAAGGLPPAGGRLACGPKSLFTGNAGRQEVARRRPAAAGRRLRGQTELAPPRPAAGRSLRPCGSGHRFRKREIRRAQFWSLAEPSSPGRDRYHLPLPPAATPFRYPLPLPPAATSCRYPLPLPPPLPPAAAPFRYPVFDGPGAQRNRIRPGRELRGQAEPAPSRRPGAPKLSGAGSVPAGRPAAGGSGA